MAQCQGTTKTGDQCKRDARDGSSFCSVHQDQEIRAREAPTFDRREMSTNAIDIADIGAVAHVEICDRAFLLEGDATERRCWPSLLGR